jgi:hypothetical protein
VGELDARHAALGMYEFRDARERFNMRFAPNPQILRANTGFGQNGGSFCYYERRAPNRAAAKVNEVPVCSEAIFAGILAHRRNSDTVGELDIPDFEFVKKSLCWSRLSHLHVSFR